MSDKTKIEWTNATWNPITGCSVVSPGCTNCYAMKLAGTRLRNHPSRAGLTNDSKAGPVWNGTLRFNSQWLRQPMRWRKSRMIFVCAHSDLFHESVPDEWIDQVFAAIALSPQHTFQILTKRAKRMWTYMTQDDGFGRCGYIEAQARRIWQDEYGKPFPAGKMLKGPLPNVWLGISAEDQKRYYERIEYLRDTPAVVRWVSAEPLLGTIDADLHGVNWLVSGGESGRGARPMHPDWARMLRDQCADAGVAFFHKQNGSHRVIYDRDTDDPNWQRSTDVEFANPKGQWLNLQGGHTFLGERPVYVVPADKRETGRLLDGIVHNGFPK